MQAMIMGIMARDWCWSVVQVKNIVGNTAEELAIRNKKHRCARILQVRL